MKTPSLVSRMIQWTRRPELSDPGVADPWSTVKGLGKLVMPVQPAQRDGQVLAFLGLWIREAYSLYDIMFFDKLNPTQCLFLGVFIEKK